MTTPTPDLMACREVEEIKPCPYVSGFAADNTGVSFVLQKYDYYSDFVIFENGKPSRCFRFYLPQPAHEAVEKIREAGWKFHQNADGVEYWYHQLTNRVVLTPEEAFALLPTLSAGRGSDVDGRIYLPVVCQNGHRATASYRWEASAMEFIFEAPPRNQQCNCPKSDLGEGYRTDGNPYLRTAHSMTRAEREKVVEEMAKAIEEIEFPAYRGNDTVNCVTAIQMAEEALAVIERRKGE